ncbi:metallophosphoesterase family protein [Rapidithrix thailandica]|uniref:Phosphoesterase n=1 Tax=Rapidithrix thailandica TaxID=413964 RepID=A0AAW9SB85_9BACT
MKKIGLISDTHSYLDPSVLKYFRECDEVWHAGDIGELTVTRQIEEVTTLRAVYGNIDDTEARATYPENQIFECEGLKVWMTHIGGYPPRYTTKLKKQLDEIKPGLFICGHSHILKAIPDKSRHLLHLNPGAAGKHGFHKVRTIMLFEIEKGKIQNLRVVELGPRA